MKKLFFLFLLALNSLLFSQVIIKLQVPNNTPNNTTIYLAGDINYWNPNHENYKFSKNPDGIYELTLNNTFGNLQYKIT